MNTKTLSSVLTALALTTNAFAAAPAAPVKPAAKPAAAPAQPAAPAGPILRISAIDGVENPNHKAKINRKPGKKIKFSADLFVKENGKLVPQHASAQDFLWTLSTNTRTCDPARAAATCKPTDIEVSQEGISFKILAGSYGIVDETAESMTVTVTYAKDKKVTDKITIMNQDVIDQEADNKKFEAEMDKLDEEQNSGFNGFVNRLLGVPTFKEMRERAKEEHDEPAPVDEYQKHREQMDRIRALESSNPSLARDLREIEMNNFRASQPRPDGGGHDWHRNDGENRFGGHDEHRFDHNNSGNDGNRWQRHDQQNVAAPAPSAATPSAGFGGRDHRDGFRPSAPVSDNTPAEIQAAMANRRKAAEALEQRGPGQPAMPERTKVVQAPAAAGQPAAPSSIPPEVIKAMGGKLFGR